MVYFHLASATELPGSAGLLEASKPTMKNMNNWNLGDFQVCIAMLNIQMQYGWWTCLMGQFSWSCSGKVIPAWILLLPNRLGHRRQQDLRLVNQGNLRDWLGMGRDAIGASEYIKVFADAILESEVCRMFEVCAGEVSVPFTPSCFWISSKKVVPGQEEQKME